MGMFETRVNELLSEVPYIEYISNFDLEIEKRNDVRELLMFLNSIFEGQEQTDKYNNVIKLSTPKEKMFFLSNLKEDPTLKKWILRQNSQDQEKINQFFKILVAKFYIAKPRSAYL